MKLFLGGTFQDKKDEEKLREIFNLLEKEGHSVWWAPMKVERGYESNDGNMMQNIIETEEKALEESDAFVVVMARATFGTAMEIKHAFDHNVPIIGYVISDSKDFMSAAFKYRVEDVVKNNQELLDCLKNLKV